MKKLIIFFLLFFGFFLNQTNASDLTNDSTGNNCFTTSSNSFCIVGNYLKTYTSNGTLIQSYDLGPNNYSFDIIDIGNGKNILIEKYFNNYQNSLFHVQLFNNGYFYSGLYYMYLSNITNEYGNLYIDYNSDKICIYGTPISGAYANQNIGNGTCLNYSNDSFDGNSYGAPNTNKTLFVNSNTTIFNKAVKNGSTYTITNNAYLTNQTCSNIEFNDPFQFSYLYNGTGSFKNVSNTSFVYNNGSGYTDTAITLTYAENITGFTGSSYKNQNTNLVFDSYFNLDRQTPKLHFTNKTGIDYLIISGNIIDDNYNLYDCSIGKLDFIKNFSVNENVRLSKKYTDLCVSFNDNWFSSNNLSYNFGRWENQIITAPVCVDNGTNTTYLNGILFTGSLDSLSGGTIPIYDPTPPVVSTCSFTDIGACFSSFLPSSLNFNSGASDTVVNSLSGQIQDKFQITNFTNFYTITLSSTPDLTLQIPVLYLTSDFGIGLQTHTGTLDFFHNRQGTSPLLGVNHIEPSSLGKNFITFILALLYISIRLLIIYGLFYFLKLFYKTMSKLTEYIFGDDFKNGVSGNLFSLPFYIVFIIVVGSIFITFFGYIAPIIPFINSITNIITVLFSFITSSFLNYSLFFLTVNFFFTSIISSFVLYVIYRLVNKFGKIN